MSQSSRAASPVVNTEEQKNVLEVRGLTKDYELNGTPKRVLKDINFGAAEGELICILGRSGCGKTTLLKILGGFVPPTSGQILLKGKQVKGPGPDRCFVFQEDALFPWLTVEENIAFGLKNKRNDKKGWKQEVEHFLSLVELSSYKHYLPEEISGGMKQRVALARVLILKPRVLLMDEPFASLDSQTREEMQNLLLDLWGKLNQTILFVTHDVNEAVMLADRILVMEKDPGRIKEEILVRLPRPRRAYDGEFSMFCRKLHQILKCA